MAMGKGQYAKAIWPAVLAELQAADRHSDPQRAFSHLERAHVLGQSVTMLHVRTHWRMFCWGLKHRSARECIGQIPRIVAAATKTFIGWVPTGNTGGANVSPFTPMDIPEDLQRVMDKARSKAPGH